MTEHHIVSHVSGDCDDDGTVDLLVLVKTRNGNAVADKLLILKKKDGALSGLFEIKYTFSFKDMKATNVLLGDIDADGRNEVSLCVYKAAVFHPFEAKRPFFFRIEHGELIPVWLGSRLSRPFEQYILLDINEDGADEIISSESMADGTMAITAYYWNAFGFDKMCEVTGFTAIHDIQPLETDDGTRITAEVTLDGLRQSVIIAYEHDTLTITKEKSVLINQKILTSVCKQAPW